jgi:hypothetical protein
MKTLSALVVLVSLVGGGAALAHPMHNSTIIPQGENVQHNRSNDNSNSNDHRDNKFVEREEHRFEQRIERLRFLEAKLLRLELHHTDVRDLRKVENEIREIREQIVRLDRETGKGMVSTIKWDVVTNK